MITSMIRRITRSRFVKNVAVLSSGQTIAQGLTIAASPIITRLYDPDSFGGFGLLLSLSVALVSVSGLRYELGVVTAKNDRAAANLLVLSCTIVLFVSGLSAAVVGVAGNWIEGVVEHVGFAALLWWLPVLILISGLYQSVNYWTQRRALYKRLAISRVLLSLTTLSLQVVAGLANMGSVGLIGGRASGSLLAATVLSAQTKRDDWQLIKSAIRLPRIFAVAKKNANFPKYNAPMNLINALSKALIPFTLAPLFGVELVGFFFLTQRVMQTPSALIAGSIRTVFFQKASTIYNKGHSLFWLLFSTSAGLFAIGIPPLFLLLFFGPEIFSFVFGAEWQKAGVLAQWLVNWWFVAFLAGPAIETLTVLNLQKYLLIFQITFAISRIISIFVGAIFGNDILAIAACSVVGVVFNLVLIVFALAVARSKTLSTNSTKPPKGQ